MDDEKKLLREIYEEPLSFSHLNPVACKTYLYKLEKLTIVTMLKWKFFLLNY